MRSSGLFGNCVFSHPAICCGDHCDLSFSETILRSLPFVARRHFLGRLDRSHASSSASVARYRVAPPFLDSSRLTVEGDLSIDAAIARTVSPIAIPRDISSRSPQLSALDDRLRAGGANPPLSRRTPKIDPTFLPKAREISLTDSPCCQRFQSSAFLC